TQAHHLAPAGLLEQQAGNQAADATESVEDDVERLVDGLLLDAHQVTQLTLDEGVDVIAAGLRLLHEVHGELAEVDVAGTEIELADRPQHRMAFELRKLVAADLAHPAVGFHDT